MSTREAVQKFLDIVCPTDTALHLVESVYLASGTWKDVKAKEAQPYARNAIKAAGLTSQQLLEPIEWPLNIQSQMEAVSKEYLEMLAPLEAINQASTGNDMAGPWKRIESQSRTAEQQVRLSLGLEPVGSKNDGCPPAPKLPKPQPRPTQSETQPTADPVPTDYRTWLCTTSPGGLPAVTPGESSSGVRLLQWSLSQLGYYTGAIGGNYGDLTYDATYRFQLSVGLGRTAPGSVAVNTWSWLQYYLC